MTKLKDDFEASGGVFREWRIRDLFVLKSNSQLDKDNFVFSDNAKYPYFTRTVSNNGIMGQVEFFDKDHLIKGNSIAVAMMGMRFFYMRDDFYAGQFTKTAYPKFPEFNERIALYFISLLNRFQKKYLGVLVRHFEETFYNTEVFLPTFNNELSYSYMEQYITMLEEEKMLQVDKSLKDSGLNDTTLTAEETAVLEKFRNGEVKFEERKIGDLFEILSLKFLKKKFNKSKDVSKERNAEFTLPLVNAKNGDNGIMYYGRECDFEAEEMTIDIVNDGAISTGNVYAQPQKTGVLYNAYLIKLKHFTPNTEILLYYAMSMQKSIKLRFGYEKKASWERVKMEDVLVPIENGSIDYSFMQHFISAQEKLIIKGVVKYKEENLNADSKAYVVDLYGSGLAADSDLL